MNSVYSLSSRFSSAAIGAESSFPRKLESSKSAISAIKTYERAGTASA